MPRSSSGMCRDSRLGPSSGVTPVGSGRSPSAPMASASPPAGPTARSASGTSPRASRSPIALRSIRSIRWPTAPTVSYRRRTRERTGPAPPLPGRESGGRPRGVADARRPGARRSRRFSPRCGPAPAGCQYQERSIRRAGPHADVVRHRNPRDARWHRVESPDADRPRVRPGVQPRRPSAGLCRRAVAGDRGPRPDRAGPADARDPRRGEHAVRPAILRRWPGDRLCAGGIPTGQSPRVVRRVRPGAS